MIIKEENAEGIFEYKGKTYYFCSANCLEEFKKDPEKYHKDGSLNKMPNK